MSIAELPIQIDREKVAEFCRARGIRKLSLFGSVLREDFDPERSDVDVLAEFHPRALRDSGWGYFLYGEELGEILGRKVDFCTHLRPWLQPLVEKQALTIYDESQPLAHRHRERSGVRSAYSNCGNGFSPISLGHFRN
jgi:hypothetical protein